MESNFREGGKELQGGKFYIYPGEVESLYLRVLY